MHIAIIIPARYASKRFPGKPLHVLGDKTLLEHTVVNGVAARQLILDNCKKEKPKELSDLRISCIVATEDQRILDYVHDQLHPKYPGLSVCLTSVDCASGTDRCWQVLTTPEYQDIDYVINLQGDAPLVPPVILWRLLKLVFQLNQDKINSEQLAMRAEQPLVATSAVQLSWGALAELRILKQTSPFSGTTLLLKSTSKVEESAASSASAALAQNATKQAIWFSKQIIPAIRSEISASELSMPVDTSTVQQPLSPVYKHFGIYMYNKAALELFATSSKSHYEQLEQLEQLRFLENNVPIYVDVLPSDHDWSTYAYGVDTKQDADLVATKISRS